MVQKIETDRRTAGGLLVVVVLAWQRQLGIVPAIFILIHSAIGWLLFRAFAEIIRILKKLAGIPYGGRISGGEQIVVHKCSACDAMLHSETRCESCGASIDLA